MKITFDTDLLDEHELRVFARFFEDRAQCCRIAKLNAVEGELARVAKELRAEHEDRGGRLRKDRSNK